MQRRRQIYMRVFNLHESVFNKNNIKVKDPVDRRINI